MLTSEPDTSAFAERLASCADAGCDGVVCAAAEVPARARGRLRAMVPGIRRAGDASDDQARIATPGDAIGRGADWLVIARTVTNARRPGARGRGRSTAEVEAALDTRVSNALVMLTRPCRSHPLSRPTSVVRPSRRRRRPGGSGPR